MKQISSKGNKKKRKKQRNRGMESKVYKKEI